MNNHSHWPYCTLKVSGSCGPQNSAQTAGAQALQCHNQRSVSQYKVCCILSRVSFEWAGMILGFAVRADFVLEQRQNQARVIVA